MDLLIVLVKTLFFYWIIVLVYRFMGKREVGELSIVDLIVSILIAELAAMSIEQYNKSIFLSLIPMIVLVLLQIVLAKLSLKHPKLRTLLDGEPSFIIEKGKVNYKELVKQRYNLEDLLTQLRAREIKSLEEVQENIEMYVRKDLPMLPALQQIQREVKNYKLGYQKTTDIVSLGRRLTKKLALRKFLYKFIPTFLIVLFFSAVNEQDVLTRVLSVLVISFVFTNGLIAADFQFSQLWLRLPLDQTRNQSVEFLNDRIRYYQFKGYIDNVKYFYSVLFGKEAKFMNEYKYEDIQSVELLLKHRYESYGTPIARDWYVLDYRFEFKDGNHFYFYWPITLDDDARFIGMILDEKVENVIDKDHVIEALKNGIHLNDYMKKTED